MAGLVAIGQPKCWDLARQALNRISHRGRSGDVIVDSPSATLGETHSSGIDMWAGRKGECMAVCDGAIYNWRRLAPDALDVDQALELLYCEQGPDFVRRLEGSFALAVAAGDDLFVARDAFGMAPLYYGRRDGTPCFASEMKALLGYADTIREFPPGHHYRPAHGFATYSEPPRPQPTRVDESTAVAELRRRLAGSVAKCASISPNVGCWLSGGLDSSAVAALASLCVLKLHTFAVGLPSSQDLIFARSVAQHIGAVHHELVVSMGDLMDALSEVIYHLESFDALLVRSSLTHYLVSKMASDHVQAVLSGEGGDELFAGYEYLADLKLSQLDDELADITRRLHNTALQRVDRCASAHGITALLPFLSREVADYAFALPPELKLHSDGQIVAKWILRKAVAPLLPDHVVDRRKAKFWEGAGVGDLLAAEADKMISDEEFLRESALADGSSLASKEELLYYRVFAEHFGNLPDLALVGRTKRQATPAQAAAEHGH